MTATGYLVERPSPSKAGLPSIHAGEESNRLWLVGLVDLRKRVELPPLDAGQARQTRMPC